MQTPASKIQPHAPRAPSPLRGEGRRERSERRGEGEALDFKKNRPLSLLLLLSACVLAQPVRAAESDSAPEPTPVTQSKPAELPAFEIWPAWDPGAAGFVLLMTVFASGLGIGAASFILLKRRRHLPLEFEKDLIHVADTQGIEAALEFCDHRPSSISRVLKAALQRHGSPLYELETAVREQARLTEFEISRPARILGALAVLVAPAGILAAAIALIARRLPLDAGLETFVAAVLPSALWTAIAALVLASLYFAARFRSAEIGHGLESIGIDAVLTLDRKARQSIRLIDDLEEHIKTESMLKVPDLSVEFEDPAHPHESAARTAVTTHHGSGRTNAPVEK